MIRDVAAHEERPRGAVRRPDLPETPSPDRLRATGHPRGSGLEVGNLPLVGEERIRLRVLSTEDLEVAQERVADGCAHPPARIAAGLDPGHLVRPVAVVQAPFPVPRVVVRPLGVVATLPLLRLFPRPPEDGHRTLVACVREHVVGLVHGHGVTREVVAGDHDVVTEAGAGPHLPYVGQAR